jgi:4-phytase / acid phosphatase
MRRYFLGSVVIALFGFSIETEAQRMPRRPSQPILELERVVLVQRHGVRSPTQESAVLKAWAETDWPDWGVGPGELTSHGKEVVKLVANTVGSEYRGKGLLTCSDLDVEPGMMIWADGKDNRTRESGEILAKGLIPNCRARVQMQFITPTDRKDPVFDSLDSLCSFDPEQAKAAVIAALGLQEVIDPRTRTALDYIQEAMAPSACHGGTGTCLNGESEIVATKYHLELTKPLAIGSAAAEIFLLQFAQGMPVEQVAWGHGTSVESIERFMAAHERADKLTRQLEYVAVRRGSGMARLILDTLSGVRRLSNPSVAKDIKLLALAGHDTNLSNMAGVFGLDLRVDGQPDSTAPATALAFELWRDVKTKIRYVKPRIFYLELTQMRDLKPEKARDSILAFKYCSNNGSDGLCPLRELLKNIEQRIPRYCR